MQDAPAGYPTDFAVTEPTATATTDVGDGHQPYTGKSLVSWQVDREITTYLPDQVQGISGESVAAAGLTLAAPDAVSESAHWSPWVGNIQTRQVTSGPVTLAAGFSGAEVPLFEGRIITGNSDAAGGALVLDCDDRASELRNPVHLPPMARQAFFSDLDGVGIVNIYPGLSPLWAIDAILRGGGFYATPAPEPGVVLSVPAQSSLWPEKGTLQSTTGTTANGEEPTFTAAAWGTGERFVGLASGDYDATYITSTAPYTGSLRIAGWADGASGSFILRANEAEGTSLRVVVEPSGITVMAFDGATNPTAVFPTWPGGLFVVDVQTISATTLNVDVSWDGGSDSDSIATSSGWGGNLTTFQIIGDGEGAGFTLAGVQVTTSAAGASTTLAHVPSADLDEARGIIDAVPGVSDQTQWDTLREIAEAEQGAIWVNERGGFTFRNRDSLTGVGVTAVPVTAQNSIVNMAWREDVKQVRTEVRVPVLPVSVKTSAAAGLTVYSLTDTIKVPSRGASPVVLFADLTAITMGLDETLQNVVSVTGSNYQARLNEDGSGGGGVTLVVAVEQLGPTRVKVTIRSSSAATTPRWVVDDAGEPYLNLRAQIAITQADAAESWAVAVNDDVDDIYGQSVLELAESKWRQDQPSADALASWLAAQTRTPQPIIETVEVVANPLLQLGDIVDILDPDVTGAELRCLLVGYTLSGESGAMKQTLSVRPLPTLFADFDAAWDGDTFADFNTEWSGDTFADFNDDALRKA